MFEKHTRAAAIELTNRKVHPQLYADYDHMDKVAEKVWRRLRTPPEEVARRARLEADAPAMSIPSWWPKLETALGRSGLEYRSRKSAHSIRQRWRGGKRSESWWTKWYPLDKQRNL